MAFTVVPLLEFPIYLLAVPNSLRSVHAVPFQVSVSFSLFGVFAPPKAMADEAPFPGGIRQPGFRTVPHHPSVRQWKWSHRATDRMGRARPVWILGEAMAD